MAMNNSTTHDHLLRLLDIIRQERECAKNIDTDTMLELLEEKEQLIKILSMVQHISEDDQELAKQIRHENRRNAYLYKSTLSWIRETMEFFGKSVATTTYSSSAHKVSSATSGRLLSGRI